MKKKPISTRIEPGITRVERPGRRPVYRVQLSGRKVNGQRLNKDCDTYKVAAAVKQAWLETGGAPLSEVGPIRDVPEPTLEDGLRAYMDDLKSRGKDPRRSAQMIPVIRTATPDLLGQPLSRLVPQHLYRFRQARERAGIKPNTIIRDMRVVRSALRLAGAEVKVTAEMLPHENLTRVRVLQPDQEARVFPLLREPIRSMARLAALTLMRQGEIRLLTRDMVNLDMQRIELPQTKTGPRAVTLGDEATDLIRAQIATLPADVPLVFPNRRRGNRPYRPNYVSRTWNKAAKAAGLRSFTFHDLKHHGATVALDGGASDRVLMALGGWKNSKQIERYASVNSRQVREAANSIARGLRHEHRAL